jgi:hypothetical protein
MNDPVNHPAHYTSHASGLEAIELTEHLAFCPGNAIKYLWRKDFKGAHDQDIAKAIWYLKRELERQFVYQENVAKFEKYVEANPRDEMAKIILTIARAPFSIDSKTELNGVISCLTNLIPRAI